MSMIDARDASDLCRGFTPYSQVMTMLGQRIEEAARESEIKYDIHAILVDNMYFASEDFTPDSSITRFSSVSDIINDVEALGFTTELFQPADNAFALSIRWTKE